MFSNVTVKNAKDELGKLVRLLRERNKLTQEQLAERLGLSRITIQNLEAGKNPTVYTVLKALQHFDLLSGFDAYIKSEIENNSKPSSY